ncbi:MAG: VPLPA-CTERM sorting domain-containing protein [Pseudomonadota bacterium]
MPQTKKSSIIALVFTAALIPLGVTAQAATVSVFSTDFNSTLPAEIAPGTATLTGVQGFAGLGPVSNQFGGNFLRSATANVVTLQLNNLPTHTAINLSFLFAAIDSLDGTGAFPQGDFFNVVVDGVTIFNESFANALLSQTQSYVPPAGVELARHVDLGFSGPGGFYTDSAYNLGADPVFSNIAHSASTASIQFFIQGVGIQDLNDESWAMDNLNVTVTAVPVPAAAWLFWSGLLGLVGFTRRKRTGPC